jgi:sulfate permease, SulP family
VVEHLSHSKAVSPEEQDLLRDGMHRLRALVDEAGSTLDENEGADRKRLQDLGQRLGRAESELETPGSTPH